MQGNVLCVHERAPQISSKEKISPSLSRKLVVSLVDTISIRTSRIYNKHRKALVYRVIPCMCIEDVREFCDRSFEDCLACGSSIRMIGSRRCQMGVSKVQVIKHACARTVCLQFPPPHLITWASNVSSPSFVAFSVRRYFSPPASTH